MLTTPVQKGLALLAAVAIGYNFFTITEHDRDVVLFRGMGIMLVTVVILAILRGYSARQHVRLVLIVLGAGFVAALIIGLFNSTKQANVQRMEQEHSKMELERYKAEGKLKQELKLKEEREEGKLLQQSDVKYKSMTSHIRLIKWGKSILPPPGQPGRWSFCDLQNIGRKEISAVGMWIILRHQDRTHKQGYMFMVHSSSPLPPGMTVRVETRYDWDHERGRERSRDDNMEWVENTPENLMSVSYIPAYITFRDRSAIQLTAEEKQFIEKRLGITSAPDR